MIDHRYDYGAEEMRQLPRAKRERGAMRRSAAAMRRSAAALRCRVAHRRSWLVTGYVGRTRVLLICVYCERQWTRRAEPTR